MRYLRLANASNCVAPLAGKEGASEMCFIDYSSCQQTDVCWVMDFGGGCGNDDHCIIDTG